MKRELIDCAPLLSTVGGMVLVALGAAAQDLPETGWAEVRTVFPQGGLPLNTFGEDLALNGDWLAVAAKDDSANGISQAGAVYLYSRDEGGVEHWGEVTRLVASDPATADLFGRSVHLSGTYIAVGASKDDDAGSNAGAVYIFDQDSQGLWVEQFKFVPDAELARASQQRSTATQWQRAPQAMEKLPIWLAQRIPSY